MKDLTEIEHTSFAIKNKGPLTQQVWLVREPNLPGKSLKNKQ